MVATINHILVFKFTANAVHSVLVKGSCSIGTVVGETKESPSFQSFLIQIYTCHGSCAPMQGRGYMTFDPATFAPTTRYMY